MTSGKNTPGDETRRGIGQRITDAFWAADALVSTVVYEVSARARRAWSAYAAWLERFRVTGLRRFILDLFNDALTLGAIFAFLLVAYALPPFSGEGDVWNARREHAVTITDANGEVLGWRGIRQDDAVPLAEYSPYLIKAVLATEDARFFDHFGVDFIGTLRAAAANARAGGTVQGGSTLTQQLAKNLFLSPERSFRRKVHEAFLALWIEARLSKKEILKLYLDRSYLGAGNHGVEAAAQYYFGKSARDLTLKEAAVIAGLFKAPTKYAPHKNPENAEKRARVVLYRMLDAGFISSGELLAAIKQPLEVVADDAEDAPNHFLDLAYRETLDLLEEYGLQNEYVVEVRTTIDTRLQKLAEKTLKDALEKHGKAFATRQGAMVVLTPEGEVKAIVGGRDYEESQFNRATDALRQPGSAFKPFVYLAALLEGMTPYTRINDAPITIRGWTPQNYPRRYHGRTTLMTALTHSYNTVPVRLMLKVGAKKIIEVARKAGIDTPMRAVPSLPLGSNETTVLDITGAYAAFANGGYRVQPYTVLEIRRPDGTLLFSHRNQKKPVRVFPEKKIAQLNRMLANVVANGTARRAFLGFTPQAGKTGTTSGYRDAWFIGYTGHLVAGIWYGNDNYRPTKRMTGGSLPAMTWRDFMMAALAQAKPKPLPGLPLSRAQNRALAAKQRAAELERKKIAMRQRQEKAKEKGESLTLALLPSVSDIDDSDILLGAGAAAGAKTLFIPPPGRKQAASTARGTQRKAAKPRKKADKRRRRDNSVTRTLRNVLTLFNTRQRPRLRTRARTTRYRRKARTNVRSVNTRRARRPARKKRIKFFNIFR